jgi:lipopolysaccharide transport system ATP-binding protein
MTNPIISVENLGKKYIIRHKDDRPRQNQVLAEVVTNSVRSLGRRFGGNGKPEPQRQSSREEFWALRDLSFDINEGDVVGIIGRNGAGKSTLLKILSRITEPSEGRVRIGGRLASLLEVGTGFHPELTGRENIFLNGAILGMSRSEICRKFDEIVEFAEVEKFLDTPVKRYSSGMYVRLAFAVAAHLEPEILVVDEVLAVGDIKFQRKCIGKMEDVGKSGRTVLFVSHNIALINTLCSKGILLERGRLIKQGPTQGVVEEYLSRSAEAEGEEGQVRYEDEEFELLDFSTLDSEGNEEATFRTTEPVRVRIRFRTKKDLPGLRAGVDVVNLAHGDVLFRSFDDDLVPRARAAGEYEAICTIPPNLLMPAMYSIRLQVGVHQVRWIIHDSITRRISVEHVDGVNQQYADQRPGVIMPHIEWEERASSSGPFGMLTAVSEIGKS